MSDLGAAIIFLWLPLCGVVGYVAEQRGRSALGWFAVAFFLSPLIAFAVLVATPMRPRPD